MSTASTNNILPAPRILSLDQSTTAVGWCIADGQVYVASGVFRPRSADVYERMSQIGVWLEQMIADWHPDRLACEEPAGDHGNRLGDRRLGMVLGIIFERARIAGLSLSIIHPSRVKATGFCKERTNLVARSIGKSRMSGDEADALGVWQAYLVPAWRGGAL